MYCLGRDLRESGQSRLPTPPDKMTWIIDIVLNPTPALPSKGGSCFGLFFFLRKMLLSCFFLRKKPVPSPLRKRVVWFVLFSAENALNLFWFRRRKPVPSPLRKRVVWFVLFSAENALNLFWFRRKKPVLSPIRKRVVWFVFFSAENALNLFWFPLEKASSLPTGEG
jgi:hypothetical protein